MKDIRLHNLTLNNFKGMNFTFSPDGSDVDIFGANATGKTTMADAFSWLLFDKDSNGKADFEIKNLDATGEAEHGLEHSVEGVISVNGETVTLKKVYHEIWSKKRGSAQSTFTGNTVDHFINGVPTKANEYKSYITDTLADEATVQLLTSPTVFPSLPWKTQRSLLLDVCGDVSDDQVIATDESLSPLTALLKKYTVSKTPLDDLRKVVTSRKAEINKEIDKIPVRIDEVRRGLPEVTGLNRKLIEETIKGLELSLNDAKLKLQGIDNGSNIAELSKKLAGIDADIQKMERDHFNTVMKSVTEMNSQINELSAGMKQTERNQKSITDKIALIKEDMAGTEKTIEGLREKWTSIDKESFTDTTEDTCPACGQSLPSERIQEARNKTLAAFNLNKAERLDEINRKGKFLKSGLEQSKQDIVELEKQLEGLLNAGTPDTDISALIAERDVVKNSAEDYDIIPGYQARIYQKATVEAQIKEARESVSVDINKVKENIAALEAELKEGKERADLFPKREQGEKRIEELKAQEKQLSKDFEEMEKQLFLIERFTKLKVSLLNEKINNRFHFVHFKLFNQLVNGGIEDCCEITVNGVPYGGGLNRAAGIQAVCEILGVLQEHYQLAPVVWLDNRESVSEIPAMNCQVINLYVSPEDKALRIETARKRQAA